MIEVTQEADWYLIDVFRVIRAAGRSNRAKAEAVSAYIAATVAQERQQTEDAIIRSADKWLAAQYGLRPLVADIDRIRGIDAGREG